MIGRAIIIILISGFASAMLVRFSPGFGIDERALDPRLSTQTREAFKREHAREQNPLTFYAHFLGSLLHGDAGRSVVFGQPVGKLISERARLTIHSVLVGLACGWGGALLCGVAASISQRTHTTLAAMALSSTLLSVPAAVVATICLLLRLSPAIAIAAVIFPRIFPHAYEQLRACLVAPHVVMAQARGIEPTRLFLFYVVPPALVPLIALAGVSVPLAFSASIPVEALADAPGIGQLTWQAALGRDLPVLVTVTLLLTVITVVGNLAADLFLGRIGRREA